jgi:predicted HAD superfamily Cof-like phosphohydrolase|tara:strand:+ start:163 stop:552 length:390 start_codon:yes stop_codon:yes gene_type:complete
MSFVSDIEDFHTKYELKYTGPPRVLPKDVRSFRQKFIDEELIEYGMAPTLADEFDALIDMVYVILGTAHMQGLDFQAGWDIVHEANMKKVRGPSERSELDVIKPDGWVAPDLTDLCATNQISFEWTKEE